LSVTREEGGSNAIKGFLFQLRVLESARRVLESARDSGAVEKPLDSR
jgi:hypothetical protein